YPQCENISVDYAVLEKAPNVEGLPCEIGWNDVGSWNAVYELLPRDAQGNASRGEAWLLDAKGNYIDAAGKLVAAIGVENLVVVDSPDALLIARRDRAQDVSQVVKWLENQRREKLL
ncbi:MAG: mannose-1-phosphate guanylyltransferase/mannose-6-phosphate isomerase, partial [Dongiaceae bacterium]